jgi:hypothetical protein
VSAEDSSLSPDLDFSLFADGDKLLVKADTPAMEFLGKNYGADSLKKGLNRSDGCDVSLFLCICG